MRELHPGPWLLLHYSIHGRKPSDAGKKPSHPELVPVCMKNSEQLTHDNFPELGINESLVHVDFIIGQPRL